MWLGHRWMLSQGTTCVKLPCCIVFALPGCCCSPDFGKLLVWRGMAGASSMGEDVCGVLSPSPQWADGNASLSCGLLITDSPLLKSFWLQVPLSCCLSQPKVGVFCITVLSLSNSPLVPTSSTSLEHLWEKGIEPTSVIKKCLFLLFADEG